jgi:hypothetical protein
MEDHLNRCAECRMVFAGLRGERKVIPMPRRNVRWWPVWAAVAAVFFATVYIARDRIDALLAPGGPRATVASVSGGLYRVSEGILQEGAPVGEGEVIRTAPGARAVLRLADGSLVEANERTELFLHAAWSGQVVSLQRGDIIVRAAKQRRGHLRVQTRDSVASVKGTVFAVSSGIAGTVVSVVEGSVAVDQPGVKVVLSPGQQAASNPALASSVRVAVAWSPDAATYESLLASVAKLEKQISVIASPALRTQSSLLQYLPSDAVIYGAVPNLSGTIRQAMSLAEQESAQSPVFGQWWNSDAGRDLRKLIEQIQAITPLLGDEIVYGFSAGVPGTRDQIPMVIAEVRPGKSGELSGAMAALGGGTGAVPFPYHLTDNLLIISDSPEHLQWMLDHLGEGAGTPFAAAIADRYQRGVGWLLGLDMAPALTAAPGSTETAFADAQQMKYLFIEQRTVEGVDENELTLAFKGPRMGMASWLASAGSGGAAEYLPGDCLFAAYASTREPQQLFEELTAQLAKSQPSFSGDLAAAESKLGISSKDLAAAFGTESAFALEGFSVTGPVWVLAVLVNNPAVLDDSIRRLVDLHNAGLGPENQSRKIVTEQETADGRVWTTLKSGASPLSVTWTYDRGYLVAASDRGTATRAIGIRGGGSPLVWSSAFQQQLPSSTGLHPSGFAWLNTKGVLEGFAQLAPSPALQQLMAERDPILVVFDGTAEQIHAASRTRLSGLVVDVMMLESLSRTRTGPQAENLRLGGLQPGTR